MATQAKTEAPERDNLAIWNALSKTDPAHTSGFKRAGGFSGTAIKPIWVVRMLTEQFGPCGEGWGMEAPDFQVVPGDNREVLVFCTVAGWYEKNCRRCYVFGVGGDKVVTYIKANEKYNRPERWESDDEAFKKAFTDAVGNAFKFVGVGADVHMGAFDDSKYVEAANKEFREREAANDPNGHADEPAAREKLEGKHTSKSKLKAALMECHRKITAAQSTREVDALVKEYAADMEQATRYLPKWMDGDPALDNAKGLTRTINERRDLLWLIEGLKGNDTVLLRDQWFAANENEIDKLDDVARREFDRAFEDHDAGMTLVASQN